MIGLVDDISLTFSLTILSGYLLGSVPFGLVLTRLAGLNDIRSIGSGNIGATNVLRSGGKILAVATLLLDSGKGWLAVYVAGHYWNMPDGVDAGLVVGFASVIGHVFPIWLRFRGGKGVATTLGVLLAADVPTGIVTCIVWIFTALVFRYSSLAALLALIAAPVYAYFTGSFPLMITAIFLAMLSTFCHRANIERLLKGREPKIDS